MDTFTYLKSQDWNRERPSRKISVAQRLKSPDKVKAMRIHAFLHEFAKVADPYGLQWLIATGRSDFDVEKKLGEMFGYQSFPRRQIMDEFRYESWDLKVNPKVANDVELREYAIELGTWLKNRYPLYQPKRAIQS